MCITHVLKMYKLVSDLWSNLYRSSAQKDLIESKNILAYDKVVNELDDKFGTHEVNCPIHHACCSAYHNDEEHIMSRLDYVIENWERISKNESSNIILRINTLKEKVLNDNQSSEC